MRGIWLSRDEAELLTASGLVAASVASVAALLV